MRRGGGVGGKRESDGLAEVTGHCRTLAVGVYAPATPQPPFHPLFLPARPAPTVDSQSPSVAYRMSQSLRPDTILSRPCPLLTSSSLSPSQTQGNRFRGRGLEGQLLAVSLLALLLTKPPPATRDIVVRHEKELLGVLPSGELGPHFPWERECWSGGGRERNSVQR